MPNSLVSAESLPQIPGQLAIIVPVYNEAANIGQVVQEIKALLPLPGYETRIIVVDGNSQDGTGQLATEAGAELVPQQGKGYGAACYTGFKAAATADILLYLDGDYSDPPYSIPSLLARMQQEKADLVLGSRRSSLAERGALPRHAVWGNQAVTWMINRLYGQHFSDLPSMKAIRRGKLATFQMREMTYGWTTEMLVKAARSGCKITEVPISYRLRGGGESKVSGNWRASLKAGYYLIKTAWQYTRWKPETPL